MSSGDPDNARDPGSGRFVKGRSGNPNGRPRKAASVGGAILEALNERVPIKQNGRSRRVTKLKATAIQMANKSAAGDPRVSKMALDLAQKAEDKAAAATISNTSLTASDQMVVANLMARLRRIIAEDSRDPTDSL